MCAVFGEGGRKDGGLNQETWMQIERFRIRMATATRHSGHLTGRRFGVGEGTATGSDRFVTVDAGIFLYRAVTHCDGFHDSRALRLARVLVGKVV